MLDGAFLVASRRHVVRRPRHMYYVLLLGAHCCSLPYGGQWDGVRCRPTPSTRELWGANGPHAIRLVGVLVIPQAIGFVECQRSSSRVCSKGCCGPPRVWIEKWSVWSVDPAKLSPPCIGTYHLYCSYVDFFAIHPFPPYDKSHRNSFGGDPPCFFILSYSSKQLTCLPCGPCHTKPDKLGKWPICQLPNCSASVA